MSNPPGTEHVFGHQLACMYCGADIDTETVVCEVRVRAAAQSLTPEEIEEQARRIE